MKTQLFSALMRSQDGPLRVRVRVWRGDDGRPYAVVAATACIEEIFVREGDELVISTEVPPPPCVPIKIEGDITRRKD